MVLMCVGSIELVWDGKIWKNGRKHTFWAFSGDMYQYTLNMYRYMCDAPKPGGPLTTRQPAEYKWRSGYPTPL